MDNEILTTRDIQDISLQLMKKLHIFLEEHKIRYSLYGGSLIGAIRHKGFIPWDDDVDIAMPQPDYERFIKEWNDTEDLKLFTPELNNSWLLFARLCDTKSTTSYERVPWRNGKSGVWIDIFPITAVPSDMKLHKEHISEMTKIARRAYFARYSYVNFSMFHGFRDLLLAVIKKYSFRWINLNKALIDAHNSAFNKYDYNNTKHVGEVVFLDYPDCEHLPKEWWDSFELTDFEDTKFMIVKHYDEVLRNYYGDYMQLPPLEKQTPMHATGQWFYWDK